MTTKKTAPSKKENNFLRILKRIGHIFFSSVRRIVNFAFACLLLLGVTAQFISPESSLLPAFLGLGYPFLLLPIIAFTIYSVVRRSWGSLVANILLLVVVAPTTFTYFPIHRESTPGRRPNELKVLSLNTQAFGYEKHLPGKPNASLAYIKKEGADIVCLQEALLIDDKRNYVSEATLRSFFPEYPYIDRHLAQKAGGSGLVLLSRYPIQEVRRLPISSTFNGGMVYRLLINKKLLTVVNLHLESFRLTNKDAEKYLDLVKTADTQALRKQMGQKLGPAFRKRGEQVDILRMNPAFTDSEYLIIAGDFNDTPISYTHYRLAEGRVDAFRHSGSGFGFSFNYNHMGFRLDHIIHSKNIHSRFCKVDKGATISDHKPISCYITLE